MDSFHKTHVISKLTITHFKVSTYNIITIIISEHSFSKLLTDEYGYVTVSDIHNIPYTERGHFILFHETIKSVL